MCYTRKVSDFFSNDIKTMNLDIECSKRFPILNSAINHLLSYAFMLPWFKHSETIDIQSSFFVTEYPIYNPIWFFGTWCGNCIETESTCDSCCADGFGKIMMKYKDSVPKIWIWQYTIPCIWWTTITYQLPTWTKEAYFSYYRWHKIIESADDIIEIPEYLMPALNMLLAYHSWSLDINERQLIWDDFNNYIKQSYEWFKFAKSYDTWFITFKFQQ